MDDPRYDAAPPDQLGKIIAFAHDLAYGAFVGDWPYRLTVTSTEDGQQDWIGDKDADNKRLIDYLNRKWTTLRFQPKVSTLEFFGYVEPIPDPRENPVLDRYQFTQKALGLLERPAKPSSVFIAYQHQESTPFALLVEARLKAEGIIAFLDKLIGGGDDWEQRIKTIIETQSEFLICLIASGTLKSSHVQNEIRWALGTKTVWSIPIWHRHFKASDAEVKDYPQEIQDFARRNNAIVVSDETPHDYEAALTQLINQLTHR